MSSRSGSKSSRRSRSSSNSDRNREDRGGDNHNLFIANLPANVRIKYKNNKHYFLIIINCINKYLNKYICINKENYNV
jgi:hypothetical protein